MEPISTIVLVAAFLMPVHVTKEPKWKADALVERSLVHPTAIPNYISSQKTEVDTEIELIAADLIPVDLKSHLYNEIESFLVPYVNIDGESSVTRSEDVVRALAFVEALPGGLPLPKTMRGSSGEIGLYWDTKEAYADINFDEDGTISVYTRERGSEKEAFLDGFSPETVTNTWFFDVLSPVVRPMAFAA